VLKVIVTLESVSLELTEVTMLHNAAFIEALGLLLRRMRVNECFSATAQSMEPTHYFTVGTVNDDTEYFRGVQGAKVVAYEESDGLWSGIFCHDGLPFQGVHLRRLTALGKT
jgi:hypothetical protein